MLLGLCDNVVRLYGFMFAPDFTETRAIEFGEFEFEINERHSEVTDHIYYSVFSSSSEGWQFILRHPGLLWWPTIAATIFLAWKGSEWFNAFVSKRIARVRLNGEDDTSERRLWNALAVLVVSLFWIVLCLFGSNRVVDVSQ